MLAYYGIDVREDTVMQIARTARGGTNVVGIIKTLRYYGLATGRCTSVAGIKNTLDKQHPVILTLQAYKASGTAYRRTWGDGHYVVAIGYDAERIYFEDPSSSNAHGCRLRSLKTAGTMSMVVAGSATGAAWPEARPYIRAAIPHTWIERRSIRTLFRFLS